MMKRLLSVVLLIFSTILCGMNEEFHRALDANTQDGIIRWQQKYSVDLNCKCLMYHSTNFDSRQEYPLAVAVRSCFSNPTALRPRLEILKSLGVSVDGYDDYNPLCDLVGLSRGQADYLPLIPELLACGANPNKLAKGPPLFKEMSALDFVNTLIGQEAGKPKITELLRRYQTIQTWLLNPPEIKIHQGEIPVPARQSGPSVVRTTSKTDTIVGVSDSDYESDDGHHRAHQLFAYRYVALAVAAVCGCLLVGKIMYDGHFKPDDIEIEKSEPEQGVADEITR